MYNDELFYNALEIIFGIVGFAIAIVIFGLISVSIIQGVMKNWREILTFFIKILISLALIIICGASGLFLYHIIYMGLCKFSPDLSTALTIISEIIIIIIMIVIKNIINEIIFDNLPVYDSFFWCPICSGDNVDRKDHPKYNYWICKCKSCGKKWCVKRGSSSIDYNDMDRWAGE